jgi:endonuclease/exonuclease/phosphatase family metal-dependent hydrolase
MKRLTALTVAAALTLSFTAITAAGAEDTARSSTTAAPRPARSASVEVMTRNIYLGVDVTRPLEAAEGLTGVAALLAVAHEAHAMEETLDQTNFEVRAKLLARELAREKPDLVGLQEVAKWRSGPVELPPGPVGVPNATHVDADYLAILLRALKQAGSPYRAVAVQEESDVEVPSFLGNPFEGTMTDAEDIRVTISDVVLKRVGSDVRILESGGGQYGAKLQVDLAGVPLSFVRGFAWVNAKVDGRKFRFITTHLEAFGSALALAQAQELLAGPAARRGHTILVGDFNSDPLNGSVDESGEPHWAAYRAVREAGFFDEWLEWAPAKEGWTSGLSETVDDDTAAGFDHRIDFVFARSGAGQAFKVLSGDVTGDRLQDRDPATGLWPSDHAGVVLKLKFPRAGWR